jgi:arylsulfatase A-like enzyme
MKLRAYILIFTACLLVSCNRSEFSVKKPNILFLMLDTLRADHLSGYGYERATSPNLDVFASENLKAEFAVSTAPWTPTSVASMFTGLYPSSHGMTPPNGRDLAKSKMTRLAKSHVTLAEILKAHDYKTSAITPNPWIIPEFGYSQGFDDYLFSREKAASKISELGKKAIENLVQNSPEKPFFLYLHFFDPHHPYSPPAEFRDNFSGPLTKSQFSYDAKMQREIDLYDGEISYLDSELGKLFEYLKSKNLYEDLFIIVVSDHGEQFKEHGSIRHGNNLFNEEIHVPLIIKTGRASDIGRKIKETVSTIDILPTVLHRIGLSPAPNLPGVSLMNEDAVKNRKGVMSEIRRFLDRKSLTDGEGNRLIVEVPYDQNQFRAKDEFHSWSASQSVEIFDAQNEYACKSPIKNLALQARLKGIFDETLASALKTSISEEKSDSAVKDETLDQLKSLGYLQ